MKKTIKNNSIKNITMTNAANSQMRYIGIDIGDGETAVTIVADGAAMPVPVNIGDEVNILSAVGLSEGRPVIGMKAYSSKVSELQVRFKSRFLRDPAESRKHILRFARGLYEKLRPTILKDNEYTIALGCPAGWSRNDRERYRGIIAEAGFTNIHVVSESRAAFLYAHCCSSLRLTAQTLSRPALVIDVGSSTMDFAYIKDGRESGVGIFGDVNLGGGLLDKYLLKTEVARSASRADIERIFAEYPEWYSKCEIDARMLKEKYFTSSEIDSSASCTSVSTIAASVFNIIGLDMSLDAEKAGTLINMPMEELGGMSFIEALECELRRAAAITRDTPPEIIILTGGASKMKFLRDKCAEVFADAQIILCSQPEFSIARGLGIAARVDHQLALFRQQINAFLNGDTFLREISCELPSLRSRLLPEISEQVLRTCVGPVIDQFRRGEIYADRLGDLISERISEQLEKQISDPKLDSVICEWVGSLKESQEALGHICDEFSIDHKEMDLCSVGLNVGVESIALPLSVKVLMRFSEIPLIGGIVKKGMSDKVFYHKVKKSLEKTINDPKGVFTRSIANNIRAAVSRVIEIRVEAVEIPIN